MTDVVSHHRNSEGEMVTIERVTVGSFAGQLVLVIHDDGLVPTRAPMLLDDGTAAWLARIVDQKFPLARERKCSEVDA